MSATGFIQSKWLAYAPTRRLDATYWLLVCEELKKRGYDHTASEWQVRGAIKAVEARLNENIEQAAQLRREAHARYVEARKLEEVRPS